MLHVKQNDLPVFLATRSDEGDALRIVHIARDPDPALGGNLPVVMGLARQQAAAGHRVLVVVVRDEAGSGPAEETTGETTGETSAVDIHRIVASSAPNVGYAREILQAISSADIVHVHATDRIFNLLALTKWLHRKPLVLSTHDGLPQDAARLGNRNLLASYAFVAVSSRRDAEALRAVRPRGMRVVADGAEIAGEFIAGEYEDIYRRVLGVDSRYLLGAETSVTQADRLIETIDARIAQRSPVRLAFLNANLANLIARDQSLGEDLRSFTLVNDGVGVDIASRLLYGRRFPENLNGTDFTPQFLDRTSRPLKLFLLGATREALDAAVAEFGIRWPRHTVVGAQDGFFGESDSADIVRRIETAEADLVLVGMGNPRQEQWIARHLSDYQGAAIAVGALFDFISGRVPRAPHWVRRLRGEWVYRLSLEPRRMWRRYLIGNVVFLSHVLAQLMRGERAH